MNKRLLTLTLFPLMVVPGLSSAKDMTGKWGLGYFNTNAPIGARFWISPTIGVDVGVGFDATQNFWFDPELVDPLGEKTTFTSFWFEFGLPVVVFPSERANFFIRPGFEIGMIDDRVFGGYDPDGFDARWTEITISLTPAAEVFVGDNFAFEAGHGLAVLLTQAPEERGDESFTDIFTFDASLAYLGFHFYFR